MRNFACLFAGICIGQAAWSGIATGNMVAVGILLAAGALWLLVAEKYGAFHG